MNDDETKVMTFTSVSTVSLTPNVSNSSSNSFSPISLIGGLNSQTVTPASGRLFFAGMMFDRLRFRSLSVTIRPRTMPSTSATNYTLYAAWDRYSGAATGASLSSYSIQSDPSSRQITWSTGGSGSALRTYIYSTRKDRYQYFPINHTTSLVSWNIPSATTLGSESSAPFFPTLLLYIDAITAPETSPSVQILTRATIEFQGGYSNNTLNYTPPASGASVASLDTLSPSKLYELRRDQDIDSLTKRIQQFQVENPDE